MKQITIEVPDRVHEALVETAAMRGSTPQALAVAALLHVANEWSRPFHRRVAELHAERLSVAQIARRLDATNAKVRDALSELRLIAWPANRGNEADPLLRRLIVDGYSDASAAALLDMTPDAVARRRRALGLPPNRRYPRRTP